MLVTACEWLSFALGVAGAIGVAHKRLWSVGLFAASQALQLVVAVDRRTWGLLAMLCVYEALNVYTFVRWRNPCRN
jgi:hypothetical protein